VWQYITLMRRIFLIDSPGVVRDQSDNEVDTVLKGVVRSERLDAPTDFIAPILARVKPEYISKQYDVKSWVDDIDFLSQLAYIKGKLLKGGDPDLDTVAKNVINDWQRVSSHIIHLLLMMFSSCSYSLIRISSCSI
jgi:nuclear GTP-binding protein